MIHPLVEVETLRRHLADPAWLLIDCRHDLANPAHGRNAYAQGHIPGACFMHLDEDLSGPQYDARGRFRGRHPLPDRAAFAHRLASLGMTSETMLVGYDEADGMYAARLWWLALWIGHERVAVLDGGLRAWLAAGGAVSTAAPAPRHAAAMLPLRPSLVGSVDADTLLEGLHAGRWRIIDARGAERYRGEVEPLDAKAGHIPGARNRPFKLNVGADGRFRAAEELRAEFAPLVEDAASHDVVHQCGSGVSACHNVLAMLLAGWPVTQLYPGSWSEWSSDPARPIATGASP